ncbi:hypothetical protein AOY60_05455 [Escherichia coli]|nr:hypothetical protein AOY60_05455 [Escherichia coli]
MVYGGVGGNGPIFGHYRPLLRFSRIYRGAGALLSLSGTANAEVAGRSSLYIDLCNCLILICSIQHQMKVNLWTKNSYRLWLTNWPKTSKPLKTSVSLIGC